MKNKTLLWIAILCVNLTLAQTENQENTEEKEKKPTIRGYGGPLISYANFNDEMGFVIGGRGGAKISDRLAIGGLGMGLVSSIEFNGKRANENTTIPMKLSHGAGGVFIEYFPMFDGNFSLSFPLNFLAGGFSLKENNNTETKIESTGVFILEPGINVIGLNISKHFNASLLVSYRQVFGSSLDNLENKDLSGINFNLLFNFGKF